MKKILLIVAGVLLIGVIAVSICNHFKKNRDNNDRAEKDENGRYLTVINNTGEIIDEIRVMVGQGTEIESAYREEPDKKSFSIEILDQYDDYDTFTVVLLDNYNLKYEKEIANVPLKGRTEVKISQKNYIKQKGDWKRKIDRWFNK